MLQSSSDDHLMNELKKKGNDIILRLEKIDNLIRWQCGQIWGLNSNLVTFNSNSGLPMTVLVACTRSTSNPQMQYFFLVYIFPRFSIKDVALPKIAQN